MAKKYKYKIGAWVAFKKYIQVTTYDGTREEHEIGLARVKIGRICGAIIRHLGKIHTEEYDYHNDNPTLVIRKAVILYQVRDGMINKPFEVREEDLKKLDELDLHTAGIKEIPWKRRYFSTWERDALAAKANSTPRDSKGRFLRKHLKAVGE